MKDTASTMKSYASPEGTLRFSKKSVESVNATSMHFRTFLGLSLSSLGMGTYLGSFDPSTDRIVEEAVKTSIRSGAINVIDTAINYRMQKAERSIGRALKYLEENSIVSRDEYFVSTKNGYLSPDAEYERGYRRYISDRLLATGIIRPEEIVNGSNCMSVPYLKHELNRSLSNLRLETIDLLYLHNTAEEHILAVGKKEYLERLESAFGFLEDCKSQSMVQYYGLASWTCFRVPRNQLGHLDLEDIVFLAEKAGGKDHGFRFIQFPFNLAMPEALLLKNQRLLGEEVSLLETCIKLGVGAFSSVPLLQGRILSAPDFPKIGSLTEAQSALQFARSAPGIIAPLVGQKEASHVKENIELARHDPLGGEQFQKMFVRC